MVTIIFETHSTTLDNQAKLAAGWYDVGLSKLGKEQAEDLGKRRGNQNLMQSFAPTYSAHIERPGLLLATNSQSSKTRACANAITAT